MPICNTVRKEEASNLSSRKTRPSISRRSAVYRFPPMQLKALNEGHTILVEDMKRKNGELFSSFVTMDKVTGGLQYTRHNPETGEIYIPKEICSVQLTPEDKEALRKGQPIYLENMINRKGEEFSSFVKLDLVSGRPQYSRTPDGFNERQTPTIPAEVYGHLLSAQEKQIFRTERLSS